jgi:hypothetical protein
VRNTDNQSPAGESCNHGPGPLAGPLIAMRPLPQPEALRQARFGWPTSAPNPR